MRKHAVRGARGGKSDQLDGDVGDDAGQGGYASVEELFWAALPNYLAIGMTAEEFWHGDPRLARAWREAEAIRRDNREVDRWRVGIYVHEALLSASPAFKLFSDAINHPYPSVPLMLEGSRPEGGDADRERRDMERGKAAFMAMALAANARLAKRDAEEEG